MPLRIPNWTRILLAVFFALSFVKALLTFAADPFHFLWDSRVYYKGPAGWALGQNPYTELGFVYPPLWLYIFRPFSILFTPNAYFFVYLAAKVAAFTGLVAILKRFLFQKVQLEVILLLSWFGFFGTSFLDFRAGNVGTYEALLITSAIALLVHKRYLGFGLTIAAAASLKVTPIALLAVLLLIPRDKSATRRAALISVAAFAFFALLNLLILPNETRDFWFQSQGRVGEAGVVAPSFFALLREFSPVLYYPFALSVLTFTFFWYRKHGKKADLLELAVVTVLTYALLLPRMKDYGYGFLLTAALFAFTRIRLQAARAIFCGILVLFSMQVPIPPLMNRLTLCLWNYYPAFLSLLLWSLVVFDGVQREEKS